MRACRQAGRPAKAVRIASANTAPWVSTPSGRSRDPIAARFPENGTFSLSGYRNPLWTIRFSASFTITSGTTTITGSFSTAPRAWWVVGFICNSSGGVAGYSAGGPVTYTATLNGKTLQGSGSTSGTFYKAAGAQDSVGESVTATYGQVIGVVTDSGTHNPLTGICVHAYNNAGGVLASTQTSTNGAYTLSAVPAGPAYIGFSPGCGASNYLTQYYNGEPSLASATVVNVPAGATASGINAAMVNSGQITGTVAATADGTAIAGICVQAYSNTGGRRLHPDEHKRRLYPRSAAHRLILGRVSRLQRVRLCRAVLQRESDTISRRSCHRHERHH